MFVKLHKISKNKSGAYQLAEVRVNINHILFISENFDMSQLLKEGEINIGINPAAKFSNVLVSSGARLNELMVVIGNPEAIESKINKSNKKLLRG